ncbi:MAG TPA: ABC transporter substrate-binding protein [Geminicoccaceae bacterium]|nr:ABC transporter substrate-binding protein [Geminicoccaceae bacterium]
MGRVALSAGVLGCVAALAAGSSFAQEIKIGSVAAVTGPVAEVVDGIVAGRNLAAQHVNDQGGLLDGAAYRLVLGDSQCDPKAAVDAATKVVNVEQVVAIVGATCSGGTNAMAQSVTIPAGVVSVSDSATAPSITELEDNDLVFRVVPSDAYQGQVLAGLAMDRGLGKLALTYANDDYNAGLAAAFEESFKELGGEITAKQMHEPNKASYRSELATLAGQPADGLALFAYYGGSGITIIRNSLENGLFETFLAADGMADATVIEQIGADMLRDHLFITLPGSDSQDPSYRAFAEAFEQSGKDPAGPFIANGYDATFLIALAIEKVGAADRAKISEALRAVAGPPGIVIRPGQWTEAKEAIAAGEDINYEGASGPANFDENGDVAGIYQLYMVGADDQWQSQLIK